MFAEKTGITPSTGTLVEQLSSLRELPSVAIVTVNAMHLAQVSTELAEAGVRRLLVEKPAALDGSELDELGAAAARTGADLRIGYNRRYLASVIRAREIIAEDGGALSAKFDFSEPSRRIAGLDKPQRELDTWFYGNSSHVVDLALHLAGDPVEVTGRVAGGVSWHPKAGTFVGMGHTSSGTLLSWHANWIGPGRWGVEVITPERRLILQPLESLRVQDHNGFTENPVDLGVDSEGGLKPGLRKQVEAFLDGTDDEHLLDLPAHIKRWPALEAIRTGGVWHSEDAAR
jgi:predicted dehydrogenase